MTASQIDRPRLIAGLALSLALSLFGGVSLAGPGTQTEDDVYVGKKRQVQGVTAPGTATPQRRPGAGVSPNTGSTAAKKTARAGGDDDLEDLEVERRKVQGVTKPGSTAPLLRPGAGTSPNTGRSAAPAPAVLPVKPL